MEEKLAKAPHSESKEHNEQFEDLERQIEIGRLRFRYSNTRSPNADQ
ncbi:MAG: hypothetical protein JWM95_2813 [Gemmatimonadetes bacterium]|nr:hypothetical protein [Gemmatimonadota bacterium]